MNKKEVIALIKRNQNTRREAIILISDFLQIPIYAAEEIYIEEFDNGC